MTGVGFAACGVVKSPTIPKGNPLRLTYSVDYTNRVCGWDPGVKNKPYGYYLPDQTSVCVHTCPSATDYEKFICHYDIQAKADNSTLAAAIYFYEYKCMFHVKTTLGMCFFEITLLLVVSISSFVFTPELNRCIPTAAISLATQTANNTIHTGSYKSVAKDGSGWFNSFFGDLYRLQGIIFGFGIGIATAVAFGYTFFLRIPGTLFVMIWGIILSIQVVLIVGSFLLWSLSVSWKTDNHHSNGEILAAQVLSYIGFAVCVLYFCLMLVMRSRVQLAIGVVKEAAKALAAMPALIFAPIIQVVAVTLFLVPWIIYVVYLASSGEMVTMTGSDAYGVKYTYRQFVYTENTKYAFLYMLFSWFWSSEFIVACGQLIIALSLAAWYFTRDKGTIGNETVLWVRHILTPEKRHSLFACFLPL